MIASKSPAFQFYAADYLADENVQLMTLEEEGAYIRALAYCWREGSIPSDPEKLSRLLKNCSNQASTVVRNCFNQCSNDGSRLVHPRLEIEREKQRIWKEKSSEAGKRSGKSRRNNKIKSEPTFNQPSTNLGDLVEPKSNSSFASSSSKEKHISNSKLLEQANAVYEAYPKHVGKTDALRAIVKALKKIPFGELLPRVEKYKKQVFDENKEEQYVPYPATWFNKERYNDEGLIPKPPVVWHEVSGAEYWADVPSVMQFIDKEATH